MKEKIEKFEELRTRSNSLEPGKGDFLGNLKDIAQEALGYCETPDDDQEIQWFKKAIKIAESSGNEKNISEEAVLEERDRGVSYLREGLDSILIRERKYLD